MYALMIALYVVVVLVALLLIGLILIQHSKGGLGSTFGGVGEAVFGARAGNHLTKMTVILTTLFFVLILMLAVIAGHRGDHSLKLGTAVKPAAAVPVVPATAPVKAPSGTVVESSKPAATVPAATK